MFETNDEGKCYLLGGRRFYLTILHFSRPKDLVNIKCDPSLEYAKLIVPRLRQLHMDYLLIP